MTREDKIELMCEIGDRILQVLQEQGYLFNVTTEIDEEICYTEGGQEVFDSIYDILDELIPE